MSDPRSERLLECARAARGFMPDPEGLRLRSLAELTSLSGFATMVEIGAWCGRSTLYLASGLAAALEKGAAGTLLFSVDHHRGSEENQAGWEHHDPDVVDPGSGRIDTLPMWRRAVAAAGAEDLVVAVVGESAAVAARVGVEAGLVFIDGGHGEAPAWADYRGWAPKLPPGGLLALHDVFEDPSAGGRPPFEIYSFALRSGEFTEESSLATGSLRVLRRTGSSPAGPGSSPRGRQPPPKT